MNKFINAQVLKYVLHCALGTLIPLTMMVLIMAVNLLEQGYAQY